MELKEILADIKKNQASEQVKRYPVNYSMKLAIDSLTEIGKAKKSSFSIDNGNRFVYWNLIRWLMGDESFQCHDVDAQGDEKPAVKGDLQKGIFLCGPTGTGKSWALELINLLSEIDNIPIMLGGEQKRLKFKSFRTDDICREFSTTGDVHRFKNYPVTCFHDLCSDSEPMQSLFMGNRVNVMQSILESRGDQQSIITLITSNVPFNHSLFRERYSDRVVSRLYEMCNYFELTGKDRRRS